MPDPTTTSVAQDWYEIVQTADLRQGDILQELPVFMQDSTAALPSPGAATGGASITVPGAYALATWVVLSPSCDLDTGRARQVLLGHCVEATIQGLSAQGEKDFQQKLEVVRMGLDPSKFMLPKHEAEPCLPLSIVTTRSLAMLALEPVKQFVSGKARLRLRHPFRERLGNWCGQWISNVGPENRSLIPRFTQVHAKHVLDANTA